MNIISSLKKATLAKIESKQANAAIAKHANGARINAGQVAAIAASKPALVKLTQVTPVALAAANKQRNIVKVAQTVCILPNDSDVYTSAIKHTAKGSAEDIAAYKPRESKYNHCGSAYAALTLKSDDSKEYLYTIQDKCTKSVLVDADTGKVLEKAQVAELMTKSAAKKLLGDNSAEKTNKTFDIEHDVCVRTIKMENVIKMEEVSI